MEFLRARTTLLPQAKQPENNLLDSRPLTDLDQGNANNDLSLKRLISKLDSNKQDGSPKKGEHTQSFPEGGGIALKEQLRQSPKDKILKGGSRNKEVIQVFSEQYLIEPKSIQSPSSNVRIGTAPYADSTARNLRRQVFSGYGDRKNMNSQRQGAFQTFSNAGSVKQQHSSTANVKSGSQSRTQVNRGGEVLEQSFSQMINEDFSEGCSTQINNLVGMTFRSKEGGEQKQEDYIIQFVQDSNLCANQVDNLHRNIDFTLLGFYRIP